MEQLDMFSDGSFDLVASCYGLSNTTSPQDALNEIHRVLKPGGSLVVSVWENAGGDPASDIILRHACVGPNPFHVDDQNRDVVGNFACPVRSKRPMSLSKPHLLEGMLEKAKLPVVEVSNDEYPLSLGKTKEFAFIALTLPMYVLMVVKFHLVVTFRLIDLLILYKWQTVRVTRIAKVQSLPLSGCSRILRGCLEGGIYGKAA